MLSSVLWLTPLAALAGGLGPPGEEDPRAWGPPVEARGAPQARGSAPLFVENLGQWDVPARFVGRAGGVVAGVEVGAFALHLERHLTGDAEPIPLRLVFEGAREEAEVLGELPREALFSFFLGDDPARWVRGARSFDAVRIAGLYSGVDVRVRGEGGVLEYDLLLEPGADLGDVRVAVEGAGKLEIDAAGALVAHTERGPLVQPRPRTFEPLADGGQREVLCGYVLHGGHRFGFEVQERDEALALVIDPELLWSTYIGSGWGLGTGDVATAMAVGEDGDVFAAGVVEGPLFPVTKGAFEKGHPNGGNVFVARFRGEDGALLYSCVIGGTEGDFHYHDRPRAIAVDELGRATVGGRTDASNFPTTAGAFQTQYQSFGEGFVFRLSPTGTELLWSTLLGGAFWDEVATLALAPSGAVVVGGTTASPNFPTTPGAWLTDFDSAGSVPGFVTRIDPTGSFLEWSTLVSATAGGHGKVHGVALDAQEEVLVATQGADADSTPGAWAPGGKRLGILKLDANGSSLLWYSRFGTSGPSYKSMFLEHLALDAFGNPVVLGWTDASDFPTTHGSFQPFVGAPADHGFLVRLHSSGSHAIYSTYLGPARVWGLAVDPSGMATVTGSSGPWFPTTPGAYQTEPFPQADLFVCRLSPAGDELLYSTFIGGPGTDTSRAIATNPGRRASVGGFSTGGYPTTPKAPFPSYIGGQTDAIVTTFDLVLEGLELAGDSVPACLGPIHANATRMPRAGSARFAFFASGAPPGAPGALFLGRPSSAPFPLGPLSLAVIPSMGRIALLSDQDGWVRTPYPLAAFAPGESFAAQYAFRNPPACPGPAPWSTSNAVLVTVQP